MEKDVLNYLFENKILIIFLFWFLFVLFGLLFLTSERQSEGEGDSLEDFSNPERIKQVLFEEKLEDENFKLKMFKSYLQKRSEEI